MANQVDSEPDYRQCVMVSARMAARALTRLANQRLKPFGYTAPQFSLLAAIKTASDITIPALAEDLAMERTTLIRNLKLLQQRGLVEATGLPTSRKDIKHFRLTAEGREDLDKLVPHWFAFQEEIHEKYGTAAVRESVKTMRRLAGRE